MTEAEWKFKFRAHLIARGLPECQAEDLANGCDPDLTYSPEDSADDELDYMADDARLFPD